MDYKSRAAALTTRYLTLQWPTVLIPFLETLRMLTKASPSAVSLFSGAGGMDVGFAEAGADIVFANDIDIDACESYANNHGDVIRQGDLRSHFGALRSLKGVDVVFGGPPCQGFSVAGKMDPADQRSQLIKTFFDVVDLVEPSAFVCENVKALAVLSRWEGVRKYLFRRMSKRYATAMIVLNASHFGVPQNRERMFFVGVQKEMLGAQAQCFDQMLQQRLSSHRSEAPRLAEVIRNLGRAGQGQNVRTCNARITFAKNPVLRKSPYAGMLFNGAGRPLDPCGQSSTLPASMGGNKTPIVDEGVIFDGMESFVEKYHSHLIGGGRPFYGEAPSQLRRLTIDECVAIQTFPVGYTLCGSQSSMYRQIGNAVPSLLAHAVASSIISILGYNSPKQHLCQSVRRQLVGDAVGAL